MTGLKFYYTIEGLSGSYESLAVARSMVRYYLKKDGTEAKVLRGMRGMRCAHIVRHNIDNGRTREFEW